MRDRDVRAAVRERLNSYLNDPDTRIVEEMGVWSGAVRIDMAVINGELCGFELKSDSDTLQRLPYQAEIYGKVFDRVTLVVGTKHCDEAIERIPQWWGCIVATMNDGKVSLRSKRRAKRNPKPDPLILAQLLWKEEALAVLEKYGLAKGWRSQQSAEITERLVASLSYKQLASHVREALKVRPKLGQLSPGEFDMSVDAIADPTRRTAWA